MKEIEFSRDGIAMFVMQEIITGSDVPDLLDAAGVQGSDVVSAAIARFSFAIADAMLAERAK